MTEANMNTNDRKLFENAWYSINDKFIIIGPHEMTRDDALKTCMFIVLCTVTYSKDQNPYFYLAMSNFIHDARNYVSKLDTYYLRNIRESD